MTSIQEQYEAAARQKEGLRNGTWSDNLGGGEAFACSCFVCGDLVFYDEAIELQGEGVDRWGKAWRMPFKVHEQCAEAI